MIIPTTKSSTPNVPKLRFSKYSDEWNEKSLRQMLIYIVDNRGKTPPVQRSGIPLLETNTLGSKSLDYSKVIKYVSEDTYKTWFRDYLEPNDVLFSTVGQTGLCSYYDGDIRASIAQNLVGLRFSTDIPLFCYYLLTEKRNNHKFKRIEMGAVQPSIKVSQMIDIKFNLPVKAEQQEIAGFFSSLDSWLDNLRSQKESLETYKKSVMQKIFSQEIRFKDDNGNNYPQWKNLKFSDLYDFGSTNSLSRDKLGYELSGIFNIHYGDIHTEFSSNFHLAFEKVPRIKGEYTTESNSLVEVGDIVIADASEDYKDIGKTIEVISTNNQKIVSGLHTILGKNKKVYKTVGFISYLMQSEKQKLKIMRVAQGVKVLGLSKKYLKDIVFEIPCDSEQQKIASFLSSIDKLIKSKDDQIKGAKVWKKGLLQQMFV